MKDILSSDYEKFLESLNQEKENAIYVNSNKISKEKFLSLCDFSVEQIPYETNGFYVDHEKKGRHPLHHAGAFYCQEPSAMFTVNSFSFRGDEKVLDLCASPGGKTIQIANRIPNGALVSNEYVKSRSEILYSNVERMGLKNVMITNETPENLASAYGDCFDVVLVDAPCSGEGMFRRGEKVVEEWNEGINEKCALRQSEILKHADKMLKQGGTLIYSTCTYSKVENEDVVTNFANAFGYEFINIDYNLPRGIGLKESVRLYPHLVRGEGQFVAVLKKKSENLSETTRNLPLKENKKVYEKLKSFLTFDEKVYDFKNFSYFLVDEDLVKRNVNYVSIGVRVGEMKNNNFFPHHYLFSALGTKFKNQLNLSLNDKRASSFLKGDVLEFEGDGYGCVLIEGLPIGGFKMSDGKFKNHYPKGLRNFK